MRTVAIRDDGAVLVVDGPAAAIVLADGRAVYLPAYSALRCGDWADHDAEAPEGVDPDRLAEVKTQYQEGPWGILEPSREGDAPDARDRGLALLGVARSAGHDVTPGHDQLHHWWVYGEGRSRWETWTELYDQLAAIPEVGPVKAKLYASKWFEERHGYAAGSDKNRVAHGKPPRGDKIGPG